MNSCFSATGFNERFVAGLCSLIFVACGNAQAPVANVASICDGNSGIRLRFFTRTDNTVELRGAAVRVENGYPSFVLDGNCSYWMGSWDGSDLLARDRGWRTGQFKPELERTLRGVINLDALSSLADCTPPASAFDLPTRSISSATSRADCIGSGPSFDRAWQVILSNAQTLWSEGTPLTGNIHASAVVAGAMAPGSTEYDWPLEDKPLSSFVLPDTEESPTSPVFRDGVSTLFQNSDADVLRNLREKYLEERAEAPGLFLDGLLSNDGKTKAFVYMRDAMPYEDEMGLLPTTTSQ